MVEGKGWTTVKDGLTDFLLTVTVILSVSVFGHSNPPYKASIERKSWYSVVTLIKSHWCALMLLDILLPAPRVAHQDDFRLP